MTKKISPEKEKEFDELSLFIEYLSTFYFGMDRKSEIHPSNCLEKSVEQFGKSKALQGLKQAVNDCIQMTSSLNLEGIKLLDAELSLRGIISLSSIRKRYWSKYKKILEHGKIKNETEYYLINGILSDLTDGLLAEEVDILSAMVADFEKTSSS